MKGGQAIRDPDSNLADIIYSVIGSGKGRVLKENRTDPGVEGGHGYLHGAWEKR